MSFDFKNTPQQRVQANNQMRGRTNQVSKPHDLSTNNQIQGSPTDNDADDLPAQKSPNVHRRKKLVKPF